MMNIKFAALAAAGILATAAVSAQGQNVTQAGVSGLIQDGKVVVINTSVFATRLGELKQKYDQVDGQFKDRSTRLQQLDVQAKQLAQDIETKRPVLPADKLDEMQRHLDEMKKQGTRELEDLQADYAKALETATKPIKDKLSQFITNYATQRGIILIIDLPGAYQSGILAYWNPNTDITEDFINEYNKANPVPTGAAPAQQPAQQQPARPAPTKPTKP